MCIRDRFERARALGYEAIVIFGSPANYVGRGFKSCKKYCVRAEDGAYPAAMMVKELRPGALEGRSWVYRDSPALHIDEQEAQRFDDGLEKICLLYTSSFSGESCAGMTTRLVPAMYLSS